MLNSVLNLKSWLDSIAHSSPKLFRLQDLRCFFPNLSEQAFKTLISRAVKSKQIIRLCRGIYLLDKVNNDGLLLFKVAAALRANEFNYISLETVLSEVGVISQVPINWVTIMSSGRSNIISCGDYGSIEFIHTKKNPNELLNDINYDDKCNLWRASVKLALKDMQKARRNCDLINWEVAREFI